MKRMLWMAALTSVAFASCVSEDVAENNQTQQLKKISFGAPVMYNQSRAVLGEISGTTYPFNEDFVVFGIEHVGDFKGWDADNVVTTKGEDEESVGYFPEEGVTVTNDNSESRYWYTTENYYLPADPDNKLSFAAYSPARAKNDGTITYGDNGLVITDWVMKNNPSEQYDLMNSTLSANITQAEVPIKFYHALSSIHFYFAKPVLESGNSPHSVKITKLAIKGNIRNKGTYKENLAAGADTYGEPTWSGLDTTDDAPEEYVLFSGDGMEVTTADAGTKTMIGGNFLPIPQTVNNDMKVSISYTIQQDENGDVDVVTDLEIPFTSFVQPNTSGTGTHILMWERAKRYVYHVYFGALKRIYFAPVIGKDWTVVDNAGAYTIERSGNDENDENDDNDGGGDDNEGGDGNS